MKRLLIFLIILIISGCSKDSKKTEEQAELVCSEKPKVLLDNQDVKPIQIKDQKGSISEIINSRKTVAYTFYAKAGEKLDYQTNDDICVWIYDPDNQLINDSILTQSGKYTIMVSSLKASQTFELKISLGTSVLSPFQLAKPTTQLSYNVQNNPNFQYSQNLQKIVTELVNLASKNNLSTDALSITLIDINSGAISGYQQDRLRYPASVVKLFWMVAFYEQKKQGIWQEEAEVNDYLFKMIKKSDNEGASHILDKITTTKSGSDLKGEDYQTWLNKREQLNNFFQASGYENININQKTFPIPYLGDYGKSPKGYELKMRGDPNQPIRNKITTKQAARLMYEIVTLQAVSREYSLEMAKLVNQDLRREAWININPNFEFNPIGAFFGEGLPTNVQFLSKAGWTSQTRQEVAFVRYHDTAYILAIFAEDKAYARNAKIFPEMSKLVFEQMKVLSNTNEVNSQSIPTVTSSQTTTQTQLQQGWIRLGFVNSGNVKVGEQLVETEKGTVFIFPEKVPKEGDFVTLKTTINLRKGIPQPPNYVFADKIGQINDGQHVKILRVESFKPTASASYTEVWAEVAFTSNNN